MLGRLRVLPERHPYAEELSFRRAGLPAAERCWFDPFLQVAARLRALTAMGHVTDKVELIVLGGTWSDYPESYQRWFTGELFRALNLSDEERVREATERRTWYERRGLPRDRDALAAAAAPLQQRIDAGELTYNEAWREAYSEEEVPQSCSWDDLFALHRANETAPKRVVGLVVETRPDLVTAEACRTLRALGCTKVQIGIQSLNDETLAANGRAITSARIADAMALLRQFGFKSHVHFMVNLLGADPVSDIADYRRLVTDPGVSARRGEALSLLPCGKRPTHRLLRGRLLAPLHRGRARGSPRSRTCWPPRPGHASPA